MWTLTPHASQVNVVLGLSLLSAAYKIVKESDSEAQHKSGVKTMIPYLFFLPSGTQR